MDRTWRLPPFDIPFSRSFSPLSSGGGDSLKDMMDGPALTMDDMAGIGGLSEIDLDSMADAEADVETVKQGRALSTFPSARRCR